MLPEITWPVFTPMRMLRWPNPLGQPFLVQPADLVLHIYATLHGPQRMVIPVIRLQEHHHDAVAHKLVQDSLVIIDDGVHLRVVLVKHLHHLVGGIGFGEASESLDVGEKNGTLYTLGGGC